MELRNATDGDAEEVHRFWQEAGASMRTTDDALRIRRAVRHPAAILLLAVVDEQIVGTLLGTDDGWRGNMYRLVVHPRHRRQGVARELVRRMEQVFARRGVQRVTALVETDRPWATAFWTSVGYSRDEHVTRHVAAIDSSTEPRPLRDQSTATPGLVVVVAPEPRELESIRARFHQKGHPSHTAQLGTIDAAFIPTLGVLLAPGGNGKAQLGVQTQYLLDRCPEASLVFCVGAAGRLRPDLPIGDVVVGTCAIEHDYRERFIPMPLPRHDSDASVVGELERVAATSDFGFDVHIGPIASGDEDIVDTARRAELYAETSALCVAWEGSGAARAAQLSGVAFVEIRVITDAADGGAAASFHENLGRVVPHIADLLAAWRLQLLARS